MGDRLAVVGSGGFGRDTLDVVEALPRSPSTQIVVVDDRPASSAMTMLAERGHTYFGTLAQWLEEADDTDRYVIAIGDPQARERVANALSTGLSSPSHPLIHPTAVLGWRPRLGSGIVVCAGVTISGNVTLGAHTHVNAAATIGHDVVTEDFVSVNPAAVISGAVSIGDGALIGAHATILQNLRVGSRAVIGAGACVTRDVPAHATAKGVPARW